MFCTCSQGHLNIHVGFTGLGTGLWWFPPGYIPLTGTTFGPAFWLGFFAPMAGTCMMVAGPTCISIMGNLPLLYGESYGLAPV